jgi:putative nucleotidyltransferase with HDIG domain
MPSRSDAYALVCEYVANEGLRRHMSAVEAAVRAYARLYGENEEHWGLAGLLHDFDYERWPTAPDHPLRGSEILRERGYPEEVIYAVLSHADYLADRYPRTHLLDKVLYACDELCGFITAVALMRPERLTGLKASSVRKKLKTKGFAASVSREDIDRGAADLGVPLDEHIEFCAAALAEHAEALGLKPASPS